MIPLKCIQHLSPAEFGLVIAGTPTIEVGVMKAHTQYNSCSAED